VTLGTYAKKKILQGYENMGSNKLVFRAYPKWNLKARDIKGGVVFEGIDQINDLIPMRRLFSEIQLLSPVVQEGLASAEFGGRTMDDVRALGVTPEYFAITNRQLILGRPFSKFHSDNHSRVCVIGVDIAERLFGRISPLGQVMQLNSNNDKQYSCLILGVLASQTSNNEWIKPNRQILMPDSFLSLMASRWNSKPREFNMRIDPKASAEILGKKVKRFLRAKYGKTVEVNVDSDQILIEQMRKFLNIFGMLLAGVGFISLAVGGIGITNMMLVSVTERIKEIGLRKALGARDSEIFRQMLGESVILCVLAGVAGIAGGILGYHTILFLSAKLFPKVQFEWVFNWPAIVISTVCIFAVGIGSGIVPALRAQRLEVVEALRNE
jgi:putative ABC transport system permease protein